MAALAMSSWSTTMSAAVFLGEKAPQALAALDDHIIFGDDIALRESRDHAIFIVDQLTLYKSILSEIEKRKLISSFFLVIRRLDELNITLSKALSPPETVKMWDRVTLKNIKIVRKLRMSKEIRHKSARALTASRAAKQDAQATTLKARMKVLCAENGNLLASENPILVSDTSILENVRGNAYPPLEVTRFSESTITLALQNAYVDATPASLQAARTAARAAQQAAQSLKPAAVTDKVTTAEPTTARVGPLRSPDAGLMELQTVAKAIGVVHRMCPAL
ncbi:hypothetical protein C8R46DRAFT_344798 [Mycena filopes]|nr:hypothetical protein C8R46DRAFT_344798 [Mycena filopes]